MKPYKPRDLGIVIPLANNRGCSRALGVNIKGRLPVWLHYLMSDFRSFGQNNRLKILKAMLLNELNRT